MDNSRASTNFDAMTNPQPDVRAVLSPVEMSIGETPPPKPTIGIGLCLSGGGYRAMVFHLGVLWRLNELGMLQRMTRISSVSGGSITSGMLAIKWKSLAFTQSVAARYVEEVVEPIRKLAGETIDKSSVIRGILLPGSISDRIVKAYDKYLYHGATLNDLPDEPPRFTINATNIQTGALCRFTKGEMRDYRVGKFLTPSLLLAKAVAASSAFPPVLSPTVIKPGVPPELPPFPGEDLRRAPFTTEFVLSDGGVYDNLGLETVWKRCATVFVSDAGGKMKPEEKPHHDWARHSYRVLNVIDNQVRSLRNRMVVTSLITGERAGAFWSIRTPRAKYSADSPLQCPPAATAELAGIDTRLAKLSASQQERLINWGYAVTGVAVRTYFDSQLPAAQSFPYPKSGV